MFAHPTSSNVTVSSSTNVASVGLKVRTGIRGGLKAGFRPRNIGVTLDLNNYNMA